LYIIINALNETEHATRTLLNLNSTPLVVGLCCNLYFFCLCTCLFIY